MLKEDFAENIETQVVDFDSKIPFLEQMRIIHNTDIFVSMHGSGLTHLLFLPDWAVVFEIYNCQDVNCYKDLARLRGVKYYTWSADENGITPTLEAIHPTLNQKHKKFANYKFDVKRFKMSIMIINQYVLRHPAYIDHKKTFNRKYGNKSESKSEL
uniref:Glycosyltransferase AER61 n=1 Tax=Rhabditophanes sp. KR3021 TaxID=114890 RepID=A0AC35U890_9BILA